MKRDFPIAKVWSSLTKTEIPLSHINAACVVEISSLRRVSNGSKKSDGQRELKLNVI